jgi:hypothetical protein
MEPAAKGAQPGQVRHAGNAAERQNQIVEGSIAGGGRNHSPVEVDPSDLGV